MSGFDGPIVLRLRPSAGLRRTAAGLHLVALALVVGGYPAVWPKYLLLTALLLDAWRCDARYRRPQAGDTVTVVLGANDGWQLIGFDGRLRRAELVGAPLVTAFITALTFRCEDGARSHVVLLDDNVDATAFRRLRVRLRRLDGRSRNDVQPT